MRRPLLAVAFSCLLAAPALAFTGAVTKRGDLDGDAARETVSAERVDIAGVENAFDRTEVRVRDSCPGRELDRRVAGPEDNLELLRLKRADTRRGREVYAKLRSGAAGRLGQTRLVAWRRSTGRDCRRPRALFSYRSDRHTRTPAGGDGDISAFDTKLRNASRRFRGLEVVLVETFTRASDPSCCGSLRKVTYWRYSRSRDRYVRYRTRLRPQPAAGSWKSLTLGSPPRTEDWLAPYQAPRARTTAGTVFSMMDRSKKTDHRSK